MPPAAQRPHRGCVLSQRTLAAPQASQDDRSLGGRRAAPLAFVDGEETVDCVLEVGMVTGDGVAEGDGPPGEFISWVMGRNQGVEFWSGVYVVVRNNHATEIWQPGNKPKSGYFKGGKDDAEGPGGCGR